MLAPYPSCAGLWEPIVRTRARFNSFIWWYGWVGGLNEVLWGPGGWVGGWELAVLCKVVGADRAH